MARRGWIYFREDAGRGYCFGKTENPTRRDAEYSKENPFIKKLGAFEVGDIDAVERELIQLTAHLRLFTNSKEWLRLSTEVIDIFTAIRNRYALLTHEDWEYRERHLDSARNDHASAARQRQPVFQRQQVHLAAPTFVPTPPDRIQQLYRYCHKCKRRMAYRIARCDFFCHNCEPATEPAAERKPLGLLSLIALWLRWLAR